MGIPESAFTLDPTILTPVSTNFSIKLLRNTTVIKLPTSTFPAWNQRVSRTPNSPKLMLLWLPLLESESEETLLITHSDQESPKIKDSRSWLKLFLPARNSRVTLKVLSTHSRVWMRLSKTNSLLTISCSKREIDSSKHAT